MARKLDYVVLFDIYGKLLTDIQYDTLDLCYNEDLSLSEIAEAQGGKTRQSVVYTINKSQEKLAEYEDKLGFAKRLQGINESMEKLTKQLDVQKAHLTDEERKEIDKIISDIKENL